MAQYRKTAESRYQQEQAALDGRYEQGWRTARKAAVLLKEQFGAQQVTLFGSLLHREQIHDHSDIDLAVWGMNEKVYYRASGELLGLDSDFEVDLVMIEDATESLRTTILQEGVNL